MQVAGSSKRRLPQSPPEPEGMESRRSLRRGRPLRAAGHNAAVHDRV